RCCDDHLSSPGMSQSLWSGGSSRLFLGAGAVLMSAHDGAVDDRVFVVGIGREMLEDALPDSGFGPAAKAPMHVLPVAEAFRQVAPGNAGAVAIQNRLDEQAVVRRGHADMALPSRQQLLDPLPLVIAQSVAAHRSAPKA